MKLLIQPGDGIAPLIAAVERAKATVELTIFRFDESPLEQALADAVRRGVRVHALIAHVNGSRPDALRELEMRLLAAGVTVARTDSALARYHSKYLIIDRTELFVLAFNFTRQDIERSRSFGIATKRRDLVQEAAALFDSDVSRQAYKSRCPSLIVSPVNARKQLAAFIRGAKSELAIYDPRLSDPSMLRLLGQEMDAGVNVRVIGRISEKAPPSLQVRSLANLRLHARVIVRDRQAVTIGSQSLRTLELDGRREVGILCRDRAIVASVLNVFEEDWKASEGEPVQTLEPVAKLAHKVAKAITSEIPPVAAVLQEAAKELETDTGDMAIAAEALQETVVSAVKDAVKGAVEHALAGAQAEKAKEPKGEQA